MNKINRLILSSLAVFIVHSQVFADAPTVTFPTTAQNSFLGDQVIVTLLNHGSFSEEFRQGQKQIILSDNVIEVGHVKGQYVAALDGSIYQNPGTTSLDYEAGLRLNLHALVNRYVTFTPQWQAIVGSLEYYPRVGYDFGVDRAHAWIATFNLGFGFGAGAGVPAQ